MNFRYYTENDYVNGVPCIYKRGDAAETVRVLGMSARHPFDGARKLTVQASNGYVFSRGI